MQFNRYAVYFTPPPGPLADFGAAWLGWDPVKGVRVAHPAITDLPAPISEITATPRKYGLHATIKPPFRLASDQSQTDLRAAFSKFCKTAAPVTMVGLKIALLGRFLALTPIGDQSALNSLAANTVRDLDRFRAPPSDADLIKRRAGALSSEHETLLRLWGYPYVMQAFRFHITLCSKLPKAQARRVHDVLMPLLATLTPAPFGIDALSLVGEDTEGMFHLIDRQCLSGSTAHLGS